MTMIIGSQIFIRSFSAVMLISTVFLFQGCGVTESDNPNVFTVPFEIVVPVIMIEPGRYNVINGRFSATFTRIEGASSYTFRIIDENGAIGEADIREPHQLSIHQGMMEYAVIIGNQRAELNLDSNGRDHFVDEFTKELLAYRHIYHEVEVTVNH